MEKPRAPILLKMPGSNRAGRRVPTAFTLIELLVVIAIIALLMSILMPALARVRQQAKTVICRQQVKQWAVAFSIYADSYDGYNPYGDWAHSWWWLILPYLHEQKLFYCPVAMKKNAKQPFKAWDYGYAPAKYGGERWVGSYGVNPWIFCYEGDSASRFGGTFNVPAWRWRKAAVKGADNVPVFGDCAGTGAGGQEQDIAPEFADSDKASDGGDRKGIGVWCLDRHDCGTNIAFMDWNVRKVGLKELWKIKWHREFDIVESGPVDKAPWPAGWPDWMKRCKSFE